MLGKQDRTVPHLRYWLIGSGLYRYVWEKPHSSRLSNNSTRHHHHSLTTHLIISTMSSPELYLWKQRRNGQSCEYMFQSRYYSTETRYRLFRPRIAIRSRVHSELLPLSGVTRCRKGQEQGYREQRRAGVTVFGKVRGNLYLVWRWWWVEWIWPTNHGGSGVTAMFRRRGFYLTIPYLGSILRMRMESSVERHSEWSQWRIILKKWFYTRLGDHQTFKITQVSIYFEGGRHL